MVNKIRARGLTAVDHTKTSFFNIQTEGEIDREAQPGVRIVGDRPHKVDIDVGGHAKTLSADDGTVQTIKEKRAWLGPGFGHRSGSGNGSRGRSGSRGGSRVDGELEDARLKVS